MMKRWTAWVVGSLCVAGSLLVGCQSPPETSKQAMDLRQVQPLPILEQTRGQDPALSTDMIALIQSRQELEALGAEELSKLEVDFDQNDVVLVALGQQSTGGYWVHITGLQRVGDVIYVEGIANAPAADEAVTQAQTYPYAAAVIPKTDAALALRSSIQSVQGQQPPTP